MLDKILRRSLRDNSFFCWVNGYQAAKPEAAKFEAIVAYKHEFKDDREVRNLYSLYHTYQKELAQFNKKK